MERLLLLSPPVLLDLGTGRYLPLRAIRSLLDMTDRSKSVAHRRARCVVIDDIGWTPATWTEASERVIPWLMGLMTGAVKRRVHKELRRFPALVSIVDEAPEEDLASEVIRPRDRLRRGRSPKDPVKHSDTTPAGAPGVAERPTTVPDITVPPGERGDEDDADAARRQGQE